MRHRGVIVATSLTIALAGKAATGDDGVFLGTGGSVIASGSRSVQMIAEEVLLDLTERHTVHGDCTFVFANLGAPETLLVGFPDMSPEGSDVPDSMAQSPAIHDLRVTVDGRQIITELLPVAEAEALARIRDASLARFDWVHTWPCFFDSGQVRVLRTEYSHPTSMVVFDPVMLDYIMTTGASWAGPIGKIVVRIRPGSLRLKSAFRPRNWSWNGTEYLWTAENLEPVEDIMLSFEDPRVYARCLTRNWEVIRNPSLLEAPRFGPSSVLDGCGHLGRPHFFAEVCAALADSFPDLQREIERLYESASYRAP